MRGRNESSHNVVGSIGRADNEGEKEGDTSSSLSQKSHLFLALHSFIHSKTLLFLFHFAQTLSYTPSSSTIAFNTFLILPLTLPSSVSSLNFFHSLAPSLSLQWQLHPRHPKRRKRPYSFNLKHTKGLESVDQISAILTLYKIY